MKKLIPLILLITAAFAQTTVLEVNYPFSIDSNGFAEITAHAGYFEGKELMCYKTNVTLEVNEVPYQLDKFVGCKFAKFIFLPDGEHELNFTAEYPNSEPLSESFQLSVEGAAKPEIMIYSIKEGSVFRQNDLFYIEAVSLLNNEIISGSMKAEIITPFYVEGLYFETVHVSQQLAEADNVFKGWMKLNISEGEYHLRLSFENQQSSANRTMKLTVNNSADESEITRSGSISVLYPRANMTFPKNSVVQIEAEFRDINMLLVQDALINMSVFKNYEFIESAVLDESAYSYRTDMLFEEPGEYELVFKGIKDDYEVSSVYLIRIGNIIEISESKNFAVEIMVPKSDVYAVNSQIITRARVKMNNQRITDAVVFIYLNGNKVESFRDQYNDYVFTTSYLLEGTHSIKAVAEYRGLLSEDYVEFMVSDHKLQIEWLNPDSNEEITVKKEEGIILEADVRDEKGDLVEGALVTVSVLEPDGRTIEARLFHDEESEKYKGVIYPNSEGVYKIKAVASKHTYVSSEMDIVFSVKLHKEQFLPAGFDFNLVFMVIIAVIILLFAAAFLKVIF